LDAVIVLMIIQIPKYPLMKCTRKTNKTRLNKQKLA